MEDANFAGIAGNKRLINNLRRSVVNGTNSHAYIIDGSKGIGKKRLANAFAKALLCQNASADGDSCGVCLSCRTFDSGNNPDAFYVRPEETKNVGIKDIRKQIIKNMETKPYLYKFKIFIVENAGEMMIQAQNGLLKTFEEPAPYGVIMLLADNSRSLLPTILSRAVLLKMKPLDFETVKMCVRERTGADEQTAHFCAAYSRGNIGRALSIIEDENFMETRRKITELLRGLYQKDIVDVMLSAKMFDEYKENMQDVFDIAEMWFRDVAVCAETESEKHIIQKDMTTAIKETAYQIGTERALKGFDAARLAGRRLKSNGNFTMTMEMMLMQT